MMLVSTWQAEQCMPNSEPLFYDMAEKKWITVRDLAATVIALRAALEALT